MCPFFSNDPLVSLLQDHGYNVVRLPRANISPLQVYTMKDKNLHRLGELATIFTSGSNIPIPKITKNIPAANISGEKSKDLRLGIGLALLSGILSAMGGSSLGLDTEWSQAKSISFQFDNVLMDEIEVASLDKYLTDADINPFSTYVADLLESDDVYVISSIIKSKKITIKPKKSRDINVKSNIPEIQKIVGGNIKVSSDSKDSFAIAFEGNIPLVFGFQATRLFYHRGRYTRQEPAIRAPARGPTSPISDAPFINISS